eukprot:TRINITY_DN8018_c0_g1_i1.p1 TRINITY_DN8018_c0_g1~~TRINITY_DN8018_c0_g1_i1.p1  ORF type:complete len:219 (+),score=91.22 TRINITY_DN8018_c0_g1_i1:17-673(+)
MATAQDLSALDSLPIRDLQRLCKDRSLPFANMPDVKLVASIKEWEEANHNKFMNISRNFTSTDEGEPLEVTSAEKARQKEMQKEATSAGPSDLAGSLAGLKFRNYRPRSDVLKPYAMEKGEIAGINKVQEINDKLKALEESKEDDESISLVPKKLNWDLKRDLAPKLAKLEKRTQKALYDEIKDRIKKQEDDEEEDDDSGDDEMGEKKKEEKGEETTL